MNLDSHHNAGRYMFWIAQTIGVVSAAALIVFMVGTVVSEWIREGLDVQEDYTLLLIALCEILVGISFRISWRRKRLGPVLILLFTLVICILWGTSDMLMIWLHMPLFFSGLLLLVYSYYKEWILKRKH